MFFLLFLPLLVTMECAFVPAAADPVCGRPSRPSAVSTVRAGSYAWRTGGAAAAARLLPRQVAVEQRFAPHGVRMLSSNELRPGVTVEMDGSVWRVTEFLHVKPGKGAAFVRTKLKNMETGAALEKTFKVWFLLHLCWYELYWRGVRGTVEPVASVGHRDWCLCQWVSFLRL